MKRYEFYGYTGKSEMNLFIQVNIPGISVFCITSRVQTFGEGGAEGEPEAGSVGYE